MKAVFHYNQRDGSMQIYEHDMLDDLADALVVELTLQGKEAYAILQTGSHGGPPEACRICQQMGDGFLEKRGSQASDPFSKSERLALGGTVGMVSAKISTSPGRLRLAGSKLFSVLPFLAVLIILGSGMALFAGPLAPWLEKRLEGLLPTSTTQPAAMVAIPAAALPTNTPTKSPQPSYSPTPRPTPTPTSEPVVEEVEEAPEPDCFAATDITAEDAGKTLCVTGSVVRSYEQNGAFYILFTEQRGDFYMLSYDLVWNAAQPGACVQVTGEIRMLGTTPVIVFGYMNEMDVCP